MVRLAHRTGISKLVSPLDRPFPPAALNKPDAEAEENVQDSFEIQVSECLLKYNEALQKMVDHKKDIDRGIDRTRGPEDPNDVASQRTLSAEELLREILAADVMKDILDESALKDAEVRHRVKALALANLALILSKKRGSRVDAIRYYSQAADFADRNPSPGYDPRKPDLGLLQRLLDLSLAPLSNADNGEEDAMDIDEVPVPMNPNEDRVYLGVARSCCERILAVDSQNLQVAKRYCEVLMFLHDEANCAFWVRKILSSFPGWQRGHDILAYLGQRFDTSKRKFDGDDSVQQKKRLRGILELHNLVNKKPVESNLRTVTFDDPNTLSWSDLGRKIVDILDEEGQVRAHLRDLVSFKLSDAVEKSVIPSTPKKPEGRTIIELSSSVSSDSPTGLKAASDPMDVEKPDFRASQSELTLKDIQDVQLEKSQEKVEGADGGAKEEAGDEEEEEEEEEVVEVRKTRKRSAIEKHEKRAPKHIERVTALRNRRKETGEDWSLGAVIELVQSFFGPTQIFLDDSDEEDKKVERASKAASSKEAEATLIFATHDRKKTFDFVKKFERRSILDCLLAYVDLSFEFIQQYKMEDLDLFRLLQIVDLRSEICIVEIDQQTLSRPVAFRAIIRNIELADICFDLSARHFTLEKVDAAVLKEKSIDYLQKGLGHFSRYLGSLSKEERLELDIRFNFLRLLIFAEDIPFAFEYLDGLQRTFEMACPEAHYTRSNCHLDSEISLKTVEAKFIALKDKLAASASGSSNTVEVATKIDPATFVAQFEASWLRVLKEKKELDVKAWKDVFQYHACLVELGLFDRSTVVFTYVIRHAKLSDDNRDSLADVFTQARFAFAQQHQKRVDAAEKLAEKEEMKLSRLLSTVCSLIQEELSTPHEQTELHTQTATASARVISSGLVLVEEIASALTPQLRAGEFSRPLSLDLLSFVLRLRMLVEGVKELRDKRRAYRLCGGSLLRRVCVLVNVVVDLYEDARAAEPPKVKLFPSAREREELVVVDNGEQDQEKHRAKRVKRRSNDPDDKMNIIALESEMCFASLPAELAIDRYYIDLFELSVDVVGQQLTSNASEHIKTRNDDERWDSVPDSRQVYLEHYFYLEKLSEEYWRSGKQEVLTSFYKALQRYQHHFYPSMREEISKSQNELEKYLSGEIDTFTAPTADVGLEEDLNEEGEEFDPLRPETSAHLSKRRTKQLREVRRNLWSLLAKIAKGIHHIPKAQIDEYRMNHFYLNMSQSESWVEFAAILLKKAEAELNERPRRRSDRRAMPAEERALIAAVCRKIHRIFAAASLHVRKDKEKYLKDKGYWLMQEATFTDDLELEASPELDAMDIDEPGPQAQPLKHSAQDLFREALAAFQASFELDPENWQVSFLASKVGTFLKEPVAVILNWHNRSACAGMGLPVPGRANAVEVGSPRAQKRKKSRQVGTIAFPVYRMHTFRLSLLLKEGSLKELPFDYLSDPTTTFGVADVSEETLRFVERYAFVKPSLSSSNETSVPSAEPSAHSFNERLVAVFRNIFEAFQYCVKVRTIAHYAYHKMACILRFGPLEIRKTAEAAKLLREILNSSSQVLPKLWYEAVGFPVEGKQIYDKRKYISHYLSILDEQKQYEEAKDFLVGLVYDFRLNKKLPDDIFIRSEQHCFNLVWRKYYLPRFDAEKAAIESSEATSQDWLRRLYELHCIESGYSEKVHSAEIESRLAYSYRQVLLNQSLFPRLAQIEAIKDGVAALNRIDEILKETQPGGLAEKANLLVTKLMTEPSAEVAQSVATELAQHFRETPVILLMFGAAFALSPDARVHTPFLTIGNLMSTQKKAAIQARVSLASALDFSNLKWPNIKIGAHKQKLI